MTFFPIKFLESWFPDELIREIRYCIFHNIKRHGKHLKNTSEVKLFNSCMKEIPKILYPYVGPRIIYINKKNNIRFIKFVYVVYWKKIRTLIIEYFLYPPSRNRYADDDIMRHEYFKRLQQTLIMS